MPGKLKVRIIGARNLPVMDRSADTTDAFAEVKLGETTYKTDVCRKSRNPVWNSEWFRFEADDLVLQNEPLQIRIMDYDTYSANDAIGKVYIDLNPLLVAPSNNSSSSASFNNDNEGNSSGRQMTGWLPIYDTMHGIRGEVSFVVKVKLFSDQNRFRQSSCGIRFFYCSRVPDGYNARFMNGFVEELVVNEDPEHQWIDRIRTQRATNEARQLLFMKLAGAIKRKIGLKVIAMGGNAVVGYQQRVDFEGDTGIVIRGCGTAMILENESKKIFPVIENAPARFHNNDSSPKQRNLSESETNNSCAVFDDRDINEKSFSLSKCSSRLRAQLDDILVYPFITLDTFPAGFVQHFGGYVSAKSVKLLETVDEKDTRDNWWREIRLEVRSHAQALGCNVVVGYSEDTIICDGIIVLSATGTAAVVDLCFMLDLTSEGGLFGPAFIPSDLTNYAKLQPPSEKDSRCAFAHVPYRVNSLPFGTNLSDCNVCQRQKVPDVLFTTVEIPQKAEVLGDGCLIQARIVRNKKELKDEANGREISDGLPFLEYEIHRQLLNKLKVRGMNALFGLKMRISISDRMMLGVATATAVHLACLPLPSAPKLLASSDHALDTENAMNLQKSLDLKIASNIQLYGIDKTRSSQVINDTNEEIVGTFVDLSVGNVDATCVLEIDDVEDVDILRGLLCSHIGFPENINFFATENIAEASANLEIDAFCQSFVQIWRGRVGQQQDTIADSFRMLLASVAFKLRRMSRPCKILKLQILCDLGEENELQICIYGTAVSLTEQKMFTLNREKELSSGLNEDDVNPVMKNIVGDPASNYKSSCPVGVCLTSLSFVPGAKVQKFLGNLNFFLVRETSNLKEVGGIEGFIHTFNYEVLAIVRSHVSSLGGNALVAFFVSECIIIQNVNKNQAHCLIHVGGDAVTSIYNGQK